MFRNATTDSNQNAICSALSELIYSLQMIPNTAYTEELINHSRFSDAYIRHHQDNIIIVLGDSHVNFFSGSETMNWAPIGNDINLCPQQNEYPFTALHLGPCLAYNSFNPDTTTGFRKVFDSLFYKPKSKIVCCLGEIDIRAHELNKLNFKTNLIRKSSIVF